MSTPDSAERDAARLNYALASDPESNLNFEAYDSDEAFEVFIRVRPEFIHRVAFTWLHTRQRPIPLIKRRWVYELTSYEATHARRSRGHNL